MPHREQLDAVVGARIDAVRGPVEEQRGLDGAPPRPPQQRQDVLDDIFEEVAEPGEGEALVGIARP
jgi:hypothetical protein